MTRRIKILIGLPLSIFLLLFVFYLIVFQFGLLEYFVNYKLNQIVEDKFPIRIQVGDIGGNYLSMLEINNITILYDNGENSYNMAYVPHLMTEYTLSDLLHGQLQFSRIFIDSAEISIQQNKRGEWLLPEPKMKTTEERRPLEFSIDELGLNDLKFSLISSSDTVTFDDIILVAHVLGRDDTYSIDIDALSYWSSDSRLSLKSGGGKASLTGNSLIFQDIFVITDSSNIQLAGQVLLSKSPSIRVDLNAENLNVGEIFSLLDIDLNGNLATAGFVKLEKGGLSGGVTLSGLFMDKRFDSLYTEFKFADNILTFDTLSGKILGGAFIEANGEINLGLRPEEYYLNGRIENFNLTNLVYNSFETDLNGDLQLAGEGLVNENLVLNFNLDLDESWFDQYHAHQAIGDLTITTDSILFYDNFEIRYFDNQFFAEGKLEYAGEIDISGRAEFNDLSAFNDKIFIKELGGRGRFIGEMTGELANPDLSGIFLSDSLWLYQIYSSGARCEFDIEHFLYNRVGHATLNLFDGNAYAMPLDSSHILMDIDSQYVSIVKADYFNSFFNLQCRGNLDYESYPQELKLDNIYANLFSLPLENKRAVEILIDSAGYQFAQIKLQRPIGFINWSGRINYDETLNLTINSKGIDVVPWVKLLTDEYEIGGIFSGQTHLSGSFESPLINYIGRIDSLSYKDLILGDLYADFDYAEKNIVIDSLALDSYDGYYTAKGNYPINLALVAVDNRFPENEQNIKIHAQDVKFELISLILDEVEEMVGDFESEIELTGTPTKPRLNGVATVNNGWLKLYDLTDTLTNLNIDLKMIDKTIYFNQVKASCKDGNILGSGDMIINSIDEFNYDLKFELGDFPATYELGDISATTESYSLTVKGASPPLVTGDGIVSGTNYLEQFAGSDEGWIVLEAFAGAENWDLNLNVEFPSNLWIKNDDIDAEFSGNLNFMRENGKWRFLGALEILRGKGFMAGRTFRIEPGGIISYEDIEFLNPRLDILASTKIRGASTSNMGEEPTTQSFDLPVRITGTLDEPIIEAAEGSRLSTEQMIPVLFTNYYQEDNGVERPPSWFQDRLTSVTADYLSTEMTKIGSRSLGVETFEIDPVYGDKYDPLGTRVTVGFYTNPNLYIYGRSALSGTSGQQVGFEYRLKRFMLLEGRADENDLYQLFVNFYWEY